MDRRELTMHREKIKRLKELAKTGPADQILVEALLDLDARLAGLEREVINADAP